MYLHFFPGTVVVLLMTMVVVAAAVAVALLHQLIVALVHSFLRSHLSRQSKMIDVLLPHIHLHHGTL